MGKIFLFFLAGCIFSADIAVSFSTYEELKSFILKNVKGTVELNSKDLQTLLGSLTGSSPNPSQNNPDDIALATCVSLASNGWAAAVPRDCSKKLTCDRICADATPKIKKAIGNQGAKTATCFNSLHFYTAAVAPNNIGKAYMTMYKYGGGCTSTGCGPNFCCCKV